MRGFIWIAMGTFLAFGVTGTASASTFLPYGGWLSLQLGALPSVSSGVKLGDIYVDGHLGSHYSGITLVGGEVGPITATLPFTASASVNSVRLSGVTNLAATITGISGGPPLGNGAMGLAGMMKLCLAFGSCDTANVSVPLTPTAATGMGIGGTQIVGGTVALTMLHAPWTLGTPTMTIHTPNSNVTTPTLPGGFQLPGGGTLVASDTLLQLVTATKVYTSLTGSFPEIPLTGILFLHIAIPEPGTITLVGLALSGLAIAGRWRRKA